MIRLDVTRRTVDTKAQWGKVLARREDCANVVSESCSIYEDGKLACVYLEAGEGEHNDLLTALREIPYHRTIRSGGLCVRSRSVGYLPRLTFKRDFCTVSALSHQRPKNNETIVRYASVAAAALAKYAPEQHAYQEALLADKVLPGWVLPGGVFTSGICNYDHQLAYHYDRGNFKQTWSAMWYFSRDTSGGELACPEYDTLFKLKPGSLIMFEGAKLFHGVTPLKKLSKLAYRYTVVFYAMNMMANCGTIQEELSRIRAVKTRRETKRMLTGSKL